MRGLYLWEQGREGDCPPSSDPEAAHTTEPSLQALRHTVGVVRSPSLPCADRTPAPAPTLSLFFASFLPLRFLLGCFLPPQTPAPPALSVTWGRRGRGSVQEPPLPGRQP